MGVEVRNAGGTLPTPSSLAWGFGQASGSLGGTAKEQQLDVAPQTCP